MQRNKHHLFITTVKSSPLKRPAVDHHLERLNALSRSTACLVYAIMSLEFLISPEGTVRTWLRNNARVTVLLGIPALLVMPVIDFILWQLNGWMSMLTGMTGNLLLLTFSIFALLVVLRIITALFKR